MPLAKRTWSARSFSSNGRTPKLRHCTFVGMREEENPATSSNRARDDVFSYLVAGRLLSAGVPVVAVEGTIARNETRESKADVTFQLGDMVIDIECKRQCSSRQRTHAPTADCDSFSENFVPPHHSPLNLYSKRTTGRARESS